MRYLILMAAVALTGCSSLQYAGNADYSLRQITDENGKAGFDIRVRNGKEIAAVKVHLEKDGEKITVDLEETGVAAFRGQEISMQASKIALEQTEKAAAAAALAVAMPAAIPAVGDIISGGGLGAALIGGAGALAVERAVAPKPAAPVAP